jgi:hypothetical protein
VNATRSSRGTPPPASAPSPADDGADSAPRGRRPRKLPLPGWVSFLGYFLLALTFWALFVSVRYGILAAFMSAALVLQVIGFVQRLRANARASRRAREIPKVFE